MNASAAAAPMPTYFVSHGGGPSFFMDDMGGPFTLMTKGSASHKELLEFAKKHVPRRPKAILVVSAHYTSESPRHIEVSSVAGKNSLFYDYYGFPPFTYQLEYPAPGSPELAAQVIELLNGSDALRAQKITAVTNSVRGLDHGAFIPLKCIYPDASIPVVNLSLHPNFDPALHLAIGQALAPLREQDILILASGQATHSFNPDYVAECAVFEKWLSSVLTDASLTPQQRMKHLIAYRTECPESRRAHTPPDHFIPLLVAYGAASAGAATKLSAITDYAPMCLVNYRFGEPH